MRKKIAFCTLGCKVNQYETQLLAEQFAGRGFEVVGENDCADVYVINSCTVTSIADRKSRHYARHSKRLNPNAVVALIGCYAEVAAEKLEDMAEVDVLLGSREKEKLPAIIASMLGEDAEYEGTSTSFITGMNARTRAYIKIEDGCDRCCAYCIIPRARGKVRSRPMREILAEATALLENGYREIILTGVNAALYGSDLEERNDGINDIVRQISDIGGDFRIRLSSLEPTVIDADYAEKLIRCERLCPHLHLSLQSGSDAVLKRMGRGYSMADYARIIDVLRSADADFAVTTDIIVGFPGESDADFRGSVEAVQSLGFAGVHVFRYSRREGTPAAVMPRQIPDTVKRRRGELLLNAGRESVAAFRARNRGKVRRTLFLERDASGCCVGITDNGLTVRLRSETDLTNRFSDTPID
ncbi:MAG: tRNA (N(6)-L-threonylcarbamoyladenosine(37)-C(2))-methylthiotransferase MtaB [Clostridiales Family XIII bacterium]|jgi:threonylcarbamoyladenosine tRNA methylthiotransferase MtaB|nr:tRNA (N(6)-L-threonylcarbamoyladenosine(37)-C(2))-methylthiotransferase MtaB [Clostridiales Family XIII bacterium]